MRRLVKIRDEEVKLSPKEYELLRVMVQHAGKVLTHKFLLNELWSMPIDPQYLRVYVRQLRQKSSKTQRGLNTSSLDKNGYEPARPTERASEL